MKNLTKFLKYAKKKAYASKLTFPKKTIFNGKRHIIKKDDLIYIDTYYGDKTFSGKEVILIKKSPVWSMVYYGGIKDNDLNKKDIYKFLKYCLRDIPDTFPIRGKNNIVKNRFKYVNKWKGDLKSFEGNERIYFKEKLVYSLRYIGGKIN